MSSEKSKTDPVLRQVEARMRTTGQMRAFLSNIALAVSRGQIKVAEAAVAVKACEQINASLYSEIKSAAIQVAVGNKPPELGELKIQDEE